MAADHTIRTRFPVLDSLLVPLLLGNTFTAPLVSNPLDPIRSKRIVIEIGMDIFIYWSAGDHQRQVERFAAEVVPAVRTQVAQARGPVFGAIGRSSR